MNYGQFEREARRLVLLQALQHAAQYRTNNLMLLAYCEAIGHTVSGDALVADLAWLAEQGLATLAMTGDVTVATLTARGLDVAKGSATVPGVHRPAPTL
jgi:hypothetical protein